MVTKEEFGQLISEFESFRDTVIDELGKLKTEIENITDDLDDLKKDLVGSGKVINKKRLN
jgi:hypothetical protein